MLILQGATIDCSRDQRKIYEAARGEFDDDGKVVNPIKFPLQGVQVVHNGGRASITIPEPGKAAFVLDRIKCGEPERNDRAGKTTWTITGASERLYRQGINPVDASVTFTISEWDGGVGSVSTPVD